MQKNLSLALSALAFVALTACGGGGGGDDAAVPGPSAQVQGRWTTAAGSTPAYTAIGLPSSGGSAALWVLANDASRLVKLSAQDSGALTGKSYALGQRVAATNIAGQWSASASRSLGLTGVVNGSLALAQADALTAAAAQADAAGTWKATTGGNAQTVTWTVAASGAVSGSSTTGCTYTGTLAAQANVTVYTAAVRESCSDGVSTQYNGVATLNPARNALTMVATSADESVGVALFLSK
ncbi:hypothetical protein [Acidovorax sp. sic0104]|uniref:hypothetical protein n=1 Tax=Acidovorax sp. sic0104 TaxID=2854784 RepID=UPI001C493096|nr:hypothetical protein [Acidovorax sp. sic0104]MBV7541660.1 hypothetical protein [Acidovorax sp. sic0104]